jgi:hypothetical protein
MPGVGKAAQAVHSTGCHEYSLHKLIMTIVPSLGKTTTARRETGFLTPNQCGVAAVLWTSTAAITVLQ